MASEQNLVKYGTVLFMFHLYSGLMEILVPKTPMFSGVTSRHNLPTCDQTWDGPVANIVVSWKNSW